MIVKVFSLSNIKTKWQWILFAPLFINFFVNVADKIPVLNEINYYNLGSTVLGFLSFVFLGIVIKENLNLNSVSLGIVIYLLSFFLLDILILFVTKDIPFKYLFILTNLFWLVLILIKRIKLNYLYIFLINFITLRIYNFIFISKLQPNSNLEVDAWYYFEFCKQIVENNFYYSMDNNIFAGYSQFSSYFHSVFFEYFFSLERYIYLKPTTNILFFLTCLFFYEINSEKKVNYLALSLYIILVINSDWLSFLLFDSLMSEGILNYMYLTLFFNIFDEKRPQYLRYIYLFFGLLIFSKQFYISLILINLIFLFIFKDSRKFVKYGFIAYLLKQIMYISYFSTLEKDHHIRQIDIIDTILDLLLFRDLNPNNIFGILNNLFIDKPLTYLLLIIFVLIFYLILNRKFMNKILYFLIGNIISNFLLIFLLYISVWRNMELESPIRFILNLFLIFLLFISNSVQTINSKTN